MYYRNAQAALVAYDLTKSSSLVKARHWVAELQRQASPGIIIALVGNKLDLVEEGGVEGDDDEDEEGGDVVDDDADAEDGAGAAPGADDAADAQQRKVSTREARAFAEEEGLLFFETSAKTGHNVAEVFTAIANAIPETSLKSARGAAAAASEQGAGGQGAAGAGQRVDGGRVVLGGAAAGQGAKEGCAC